MSDDLFNLILWGSAIALLVFSKMRGRNGRFCVETLHFGIAPLALFGALDSGIRGDNGIAILLVAVAVTAIANGFRIRSESRSTRGNES